MKILQIYIILSTYKQILFYKFIFTGIMAYEAIVEKIRIL